MAKNLNSPSNYQSIGDGRIEADYVEIHDKKYKLSKKTGGILIATGAIAGAVFVILFNKITGKPELVNKNDYIEPTTLSDEVTREIDIAYEKVEDFIDDFNTTKARSIMLDSDNNKLLAVSFDQTMSSYVFVNNLSNARFNQIYSGTEITRTEIDKNADEFDQVMTLYYGRATTQSGYANMIEDRKSRELFEKFENMALEYNRKTVEERIDYAKYIIEEYRKLISDDSQLRDYDPGVVLFVSKVFPKGYAAAWRNSSVQFPQDLFEKLNQIKADYCKIIYSNLEEKITFNNITNVANKVQTNQNIYSDKKAEIESSMTSTGYYELEDSKYLVKKVDFFKNGNYSQKQQSSVVTAPKATAPSTPKTNSSSSSVAPAKQDQTKEQYTETEIEDKNFYEEIKGEAYEAVADSDIYEIMFDAYKNDDDYDHRDIRDIRSDIIDDYEDDLKYDDNNKATKTKMLAVYKEAVYDAITRTEKNAKKDAKQFIKDKEKYEEKEGKKDNLPSESKPETEVEIIINSDDNGNKIKFDGDITLEDGTKLSDYLKQSSTSSVSQLNTLKAMRSLIHETQKEQIIDLNDQSNGKSL